MRSVHVKREDHQILRKDLSERVLTFSLCIIDTLRRASFFDLSTLDPRRLLDLSSLQWSAPESATRHPSQRHIMEIVDDVCRKCNIKEQR